MSIEEKLEILNNRMAEIELSFTQLRLDLQSGGIIHNEEYIPPQISDIPQEHTKSNKANYLEDNDPF